MDKETQLRIVGELCTGLLADMVAALPRVPETWNGKQLRQWAIHLLAENYNPRLLPSQVKEYRNARAVNYL